MAIPGAIREIFRRRPSGLLGAAFVRVTLAGMPSAGQVADEYHVKAAFLFNFARFVEWPPTAFRNQRDPFTICVLGADPFDGALDETVGGKQVGDRAFRILRIPEAAQASACQILFISSSERKRTAAIIAALPSVGVLTAGETDGFAATGGVINFTMNEGHVRFQVNRRAAERADLQISSRLLSLAQIVDR
jgi:hypothetical protein